MEDPTKAVILVAVIELLSVKIQPWHLDDGGSIRRGHRKGLLTDEVEAAENTNKDKITRHKKIRAMALIPC